jgi:hypothetical protein
MNIVRECGQLRIIWRFCLGIRACDQARYGEQKFVSHMVLEFLSEKGNCQAVIFAFPLVL